MHPSLRLSSAARVRQPLIHFIGKRQWPSQPEPAHPHPFAPAELKQAFSNFVAKFQASGKSQTSVPSSQSKGQAKEGVHVYDEFWQAPERLWKHDLSETEIEAITSGGASLY